MHVLGKIRLSVDDDASTSVAGQKADITRWAEAHGHTMCGWAVDTDVSGAVDPLSGKGTKTEFGRWLQHLDGGPGQSRVELVVTSKMDRFSRNLRTALNVIDYLKNHGVEFISIAESIDTRQPSTKMMLSVSGAMAEAERDLIVGRVVASRARLRQAGRWSGGPVPYGYQSEPLPGGGFTLVQNPETVPVVRGIIYDLLGGKSISSIARSLTQDNIPAPRGGTRWHASMISKILRNPALVGYQRQSGAPHGVIVRDSVGDPVTFTENPILTLDEHERVLEAVRQRSPRTDQRRSHDAALSGLVTCSHGERMFHDTAKRYSGGVNRYYRTKTCCRLSIRAEKLEELAEIMFLALYGEAEQVRWYWKPGSANEPALKQAVANAEALGKLLASSTSDSVRSQLTGQLSVLISKIEQLEAEPASEGGWIDVPTGLTYAQAWTEAEGATARRHLLVDGGFRFAVGKHEDGDWLVTVKSSDSPALRLEGGSPSGSVGGSGTDPRW